MGNVWLKVGYSQSGDGKGAGSGRETGDEGLGPFSQSSVNDYLVSDGFLLSLRMCKRGFQDLLKVRPSSLLMFVGASPVQWLL